LVAAFERETSFFGLRHKPSEARPRKGRPPPILRVGIKNPKTVLSQWTSGYANSVPFVEKARNMARTNSKAVSHG